MMYQCEHCNKWCTGEEIIKEPFYLSCQKCHEECEHDWEDFECLNCGESILDDCLNSDDSSEED